jgi:hypothetical protein
VGAAVDYFWRTLSLALLAMLIGLVVAMVRDDLEPEHPRH